MVACQKNLQRMVAAETPPSLRLTGIPSRDEVPPCPRTPYPRLVLHYVAVGHVGVLAVQLSMVYGPLSIVHCPSPIPNSLVALPSPLDPPSARAQRLRPANGAFTFPDDLHPLVRYSSPPRQPLDAPHP